MEKIAWFITHDDYIDRRIFFFVDVLEKKGYQVKLFPAFYINVLSSMDPFFVKRPVSKKIVREYNVDFSEILETEKLIIERIKADSEYIVQNGRGAEEIAELLLEIGMKDKVRISAQDGQYCVTILNEEYTLCYNSLTGSLCRIMTSNKTLELRKCEQAILDVILEQKEGIVDAGEGISVLQNIDVSGSKQVYASIFAAGVMYIYDEKAETLTEVIPYSYDSEVDVINGREFDYIDYKNIIYNYAPIMRRVKEELLIETPDIVYIADLPTLPIGVMLKEISGCKLIVDCHEWWYKQTVLWEEQNKEKIEMVDQFEGLLYPLCDLRITVGENLAKRMQECYKCPFEVIYSCMSQKLSQHSIIDNRFIHKKYNLPDDSKVAIFQGGMSTFRNLENLARATKYLEEDSYLLLLTSGDYQEEFRHILDNEGNPDRVIWGGWINQEELLNYTQNVDLGIIPYTAVNDYSECFVPNKLMEYFEVQLPIFYDTSMYELNLVAGGNHVGYGADLKNVEEFGTELNALLHDELKLRELKSNYEYCHDKFGYESQKSLFEAMLLRYGVLDTP